MMNYQWPGNVRELQNVIERALILNPQGPLTFENLGTHTLYPTKIPDASPVESYNLDEAMARHIGGVLKITSGKIRGPEGAAELLGINPSTLRNRMKKLGIHYEREEEP